MIFDGKTYRNLQDQVGYLTQYLETNALANEMGIKVLGRVDTATDLPANDPDHPFEYGDAYMVGEEGHTPYRMYVWTRDDGSGNPGWFDIGYFPTAPDEFSIVTVNGEPVHEWDADTKLDKSTATTTNTQAYTKLPDGSQSMLAVGGAVAGRIPWYLSDGRLQVGTPTADDDAAPKKYVDDGFVGKQSGATSFKQVYGKQTDGSQYMQVINGKDMDAAADRIAYFGTDGRLRVGTPVNDKDAAPKKYVDDNTSGKLYKHSITISLDCNTDPEAVILEGIIITKSNTAVSSVSALYSIANSAPISFVCSSEDQYGTKYRPASIYATTTNYYQSNVGPAFMLIFENGTTKHINGLDTSYNTDLISCSITDVVTEF